MDYNAWSNNPIDLIGKTFILSNGKEIVLTKNLYSFYAISDTVEEIGDNTQTCYYLNRWEAKLK